MGLFGESNQEKELEIIKIQAEIIRDLTRQKELPKATALRANYITTDSSGNLIFNNTSTTNSMAAQNVNVLGNQNTVPGQIVPLAADLATVLPFSSIQAGSEAYTAVDQATGTTSVIATVGPTPGGSEGQFTVTRISGQAGVVLVSYTALAADGVTKITNAPAAPGGAPVPDTITFQPVTATGPAAALSATYGSPS